VNDKNKGLYPKYHVEKIVDKGNGQSSEPVEDWVFVLNPKTDPGARFALRAYAVWAERHGWHRLAADIREQLGED
jgi:hypothetical protein